MKILAFGEVLRDVYPEEKHTVGAGGSLSAAFLVNFLKGKSIDACLDAAVKLSSFAVSRKAAVPDYNGRDFI